MKPYWNKSIAAWLVLLLALSPLFVLPQTGHASAGIPSAGFGKALEFDGFSTFVELNNPIAAGSAFTEEVWLYPPSSGGYQGVLGYQALYGLSNSRSPSLYVYDQTGLHGGYADDDGNFLYWQVPNVLTVGVWNHVAVTFDGTRYKAYVNGDQVYDSDTDDNGFVYASHAPSSSYPITWIGKVDKVFNGGIDEVRIWDTALTPTEIQAWINRGLTADHPEYAHLKGYWQFNQGTGSTLTGAVGGDGTLINSPTWVDADIHVKYEVGQQGGSTTVQLFGYDDVGTPLTQAIVSAPSHGTLLENGNGEWTYTHSGDGSTSDSFTYKVNNGTSDSGNVATVELVIPPSSNADLSGLALSSGTLNEPFASGTTSYTANVANGVSSVTVTAAVYDSNATLQVNGVPMTSGVASGAISLSVGDTAIPVVVTAQDGTTTKTYTVTVTRAGLSDNADLSGLALSSGTLNEPFASGTTSYTANVANGVSSVTVTAAVYDSNATLQVNGVPMTSGVASGAISLNVGDTAIPVVVTAQDGTTTKTYTVTVTRAGLSGNADLNGLALSSGPLNEPFASGTTSYTANVANGVSSVTVTAAVYDSNATLQVNGVPATSGAVSGAISLSVGDTAIPVVVTAQDGTTTKTYTVTVTRASLSSNADLSGLALSSGTLNEPFASGTTSYTANVANGVSSVTVTAAVYDSNATLQVNDVPTTSGAASEAISLSVGDTAIPIVVTAQDGTMKTYTITVNKLYTLTYDSNDSTSGSAPSPVSQYYNTTVAVSGNTGNLARTGYTFAGWNAAADGSGATYAANDPLTLGSDVTLYAKWTINKVRYGSSSSGGTSGEAEQPTELPVIVDGKPQHQMATGSTVTENGQDSLTATLDAAQLSAQLAQEGDKPVVVVPIAANVGRVDAVLTGDAVKAMENKQATLEIQTLKGSYKLPMAEVAIDQVSNRLGANVKLADIVVHVGIAQSDAAAAQLLDTAADQGEFTVVLPPVDFTISASFNGKTVSVDQFSSYVQREIPLPEDAVPDQITTAIALNADGTTRHVPTYLISRDGSYYAIVNSLTNSTYALIWHPMTFADVEGHWSQDAVNDMASRLIVNGVDATHYQPDAAITRAEFAAIVVRALGLAANGQAAVFRDVKSDDWYAGAAAKAQEYGLIEGYADGTFRPGQRITREEATVMMARAMQLTGLNTSLDNAAMDDLLAAFEDGAEVSAWAKPAVAAAVERGVIAGSGNKLLPSLPITRAETAAIVQRMLIEAKLINNG